MQNVYTVLAKLSNYDATYANQVWYTGSLLVGLLPMLLVTFEVASLIMLSPPLCFGVSCCPHFHSFPLKT